MKPHTRSRPAPEHPLPPIDTYTPISHTHRSLPILASARAAAVARAPPRSDTKAPAAAHGRSDSGTATDSDSPPHIPTSGTAPYDAEILEISTLTGRVVVDVGKRCCCRRLEVLSCFLGRRPGEGMGEVGGPRIGGNGSLGDGVRDCGWFIPTWSANTGEVRRKRGVVGHRLALYSRGECNGLVD